MSPILHTFLVVSILGGVSAFLLGVISKATYIPVDPKITAVRDALPGANCGACGYAGCDACAAAIAKGEAPITACKVGGEKSAAAIAEIMGGEAGETQRMVSCVLCQGDCDHTTQNFDYSGVEDCRLMSYNFGGSKSCSYGCLGCGSCKNVCEYGAIRIENGIAVINEEKCVACLKCIGVCPKHIIQLIPYHAPAVVKCSNPEFGKGVKEACSIGCIGCSLCTKMAPEEFKMEGKLSRPTYHKGYDMEKAKVAAEKCPAKCIILNQYPDVNAVPEEEPAENETVKA